jgi:hypothetical protein
MKNKDVARPKLSERNQTEPVAALEPTNVAPVLTMNVADISRKASLHEAEIRELAFSLYEQRGRRDGHDLEDWLEAEALLQSQPKQAS